MFYSASTTGFYDLSIHGDNIPDDAVEITADEHANLLDLQSQGYTINASEDGRPIAVPPAPLTDSEIARSQIVVLERSVTSRRIREAISGDQAAIDFIDDVNSQIETLRARL